MAGKGLEALIPSKGQKPIKFTPEKEAVFLIEVEKIKPNPHQPRKDFDKTELKSLADSIGEHGILQPLIVTKIETLTEGMGGIKVEYELIAGERRLEAAKMAGFSRVPVIVRKPTEQQKLELSLVENVQREDLNPMEKAHAFKRLADEFNLSQKEIAGKVGKSRTAVANTIRLLNLPSEIQKAIKTKKISEGHARAILSIPDVQKQKIFVKRIIRANLSVRRAEEIARGILHPAKMSAEEFPGKFEALEEKLREIFGIEKLDLKIKDGKPRLTVEFESEKELKKFGERLTR